jgi:hypothetical protein
MEGLQRTWLLGGIVPLLIAAVASLAVSTMAKTNAGIDSHVIERGFQGMLALCAALFLTGFWLDGRWTHSERVALRVHAAAGGNGVQPKRPQLAAQADVATATVEGSHRALVLIGSAIAAAAVISTWAGLGVGGGAQILLVGLAYQLFIYSRQAYYQELLSAAMSGELVAPERAPDPKSRNRK